MKHTLQRWVDAEESAWMPPWPRPRNAREREVRRLRVWARRQLRKEENLNPLVRAVRTLAWPVLLPVKAWRRTRWAASGDGLREWGRGVAELAGHNIRAGTLAYGRAAGMDIGNLARLYLSDQENQALLRRIQSSDPAFGIGNKREFARHCREHGLPTIPLVAEGRGQVVTAQGDRPTGDLFFKPADGYGGRGAVRLRADSEGHWQTKAGERIGWTSLGEWAGQRHEGDWVLQPALPPDARWAGWTTQALGTMRVLTMAESPSASPRVIAATLRLAGGTGEVDNFSSGGWSTEIDANTGRLSRAHSRNPRRWVTHYPETGAAIEGAVVPEWAAVGELACRAHASVPGLVFVGWDVTLQPTGPVLVEANPIWNIWPTLFLGATDYLAVMSRRLAIECVKENLGRTP